MSKAGALKTLLEKGFFSPLQEAVRQAPQKKMPVEQWQNYLKPGRMVKREGMKFPIKKGELEFTEPLWKLLSYRDPAEAVSKEQLSEILLTPWLNRLKTEPTQRFDDPMVSTMGPMRSGYKEDRTALGGLKETQYHYPEDTISWSRSSYYDLPDQEAQVQLIEEIQSDVHQRGRKKGYRTPEEEEEFQTLKLIYADPVPGGYGDDPNYKRLRELKQKVQGGIPYGDPKEYAQLELSKQLIEAAEGGRDYLGLTTGQDQIQRYPGLGEEGKEGMKYMYDVLYPSVMKKLAKKLGTTVEEVEIF